MEGLDEILLVSTKQSPVAEDITWSDKIDRVLRRDLSRTWRLSKVANMLGLSPRTLQRELGKTGQTFTELVDRARRIALDRRSCRLPMPVRTDQGANPSCSNKSGDCLR
jgi:AraC-like DNA-binding protein